MAIAKIKWEIRARVIAKGPYKRSSLNLHLADLWNLHGIFL
jgi:hypothetical protein